MCGDENSRGSRINTHTSNELTNELRCSMGRRRRRRLVFESCCRRRPPLILINCTPASTGGKKTRFWCNFFLGFGDSPAKILFWTILKFGHFGVKLDHFEVNWAPNHTFLRSFLSFGRLPRLQTLLSKKAVIESSHLAEFQAQVTAKHDDHPMMSLD